MHSQVLQGRVLTLDAGNRKIRVKDKPKSLPDRQGVFHWRSSDSSCCSKDFQAAPRSAQGFSVIELLIVCVIIFVVSGFALMQVTQARQVGVRNNAAREITSHLEQARLDSVRRHATVTAQMAQVTIINSSYYTYTIDSDGDGTLDTPRVINLPAGSGLSLNGPFPRSIIFNWRGRTVDSSGSPITPGAITIGSGSSVSTINIDRSGETDLNVVPTTSQVTNSSAPAAAYRQQTQIP